MKSKDPTMLLQVSDDVANEKVNNIRLSSAMQYSVVDLNLSQNNTVNIEHMANDSPSAYQVSFLKRMAFALGNGSTLFADFLVGLTNLWVFLLVGVLAWITARYYKIKLVTAAKSA